MGNFLSREKKIQNFPDHKKYDELSNALKETNINRDYDMMVFIDCSRSNLHVDGSSNHDIPLTYPKVSKHILINPYLYILDLLHEFVNEDDQSTISLYFSSTEKSLKTHNIEKVNNRYIDGGVVDVKTNICDSVDELMNAYVGGINSMNMSDFSNIDTKKNVIVDILNHVNSVVENTKKYTIVLIITDGYTNDETASLTTIDIIKTLFSLSSNPVSVVFACTNNKSDIFFNIDRINYKQFNLSKKEINRIESTKKFDNTHSFYVKDFVNRQLVSTNIRKKLFTEIFMEIPQQYKYIQQSNVQGYKPVLKSKIERKDKTLSLDSRKRGGNNMNDSILFINMNNRKKHTNERLKYKDYQTLMELVRNFDNGKKDTSQAIICDRPIDMTCIFDKT